VTAPHIRHGDALDMDWAALLPPDQCSYIFGNPPFIGAKFQTDGQRAQVRRLAALPGSGGTLDYVAGWFIKAANFAAAGSAHVAFVARGWKSPSPTAPSSGPAARRCIA
jgi:hypothetical protein